MFFTPFLAVVDIAISITISLIIAAISIVLSELLRPKPKIEDARPKELGDFTFPTAVEGRAVPIVFGTVKLQAPNVTWFGDFRQVKVKETVKTGLWSKKSFVKGYRYFFGMQLGLCRGPIDAVTGIWIGEDRVFTGSSVGEIIIDEPQLFGGEDFGQGGMQGRFIIHEGDEVQVADAYLLTQQGGASLTPGYRGTCYGVWVGPSEAVPFGSTFGLNGFIGTQTSITPWTFEVQRLPNSLGIPGGDHIVNLFDANPMAVAYELLTDTDWGLGLPASDIDVAGFRTAGTLLASEGNGWSWVLDNQIEAVDVLKEIERQIDGIIFFDQVSGQFKVNLARGGYDIDLIPQVTTGAAGNILETKDFTRGTWDETANQLRVGFSDRARDYFNTFTPAPALANQRIQNGEQVQVEVKFPGVKDKTLATKLASRELRGLAVPLAKAQIVVDRGLFAVAPLDAVAFTDETLGITKLAMRIMGIDFGSLERGRLTLSLVQDVFGDFSPFTAPNDDGLWVPPVQEADPIPLIDSVVFEAPRAFQLARDDALPGTIDRIWSGGRAQTGEEIMYRAFQRNAVGAPAGAYSEAAEIFDFLFIGTLGVDIFNSRPNPTTGPIRLDASPDTLAVILEAFAANPTPSAGDIGQNLSNLILIGDEFLAVTSVVDQTTFIDLVTVYSGLLDTVVAPHVNGVPVYLLFAGGGLTDATIPRGNQVDFQQRPESRDEIVSEFSAPVTNFTMADRARRPYPPNNLFLNGVRFETTVNFDDQRPTTSGLDNRGIDVWYQRRDFRTTEEVQALGAGIAGNPPTITDAADLDATFPVANDTKYQIEVIDDPLGAATSLFTTAFNSGENNIFLSRTKILRETSGVIPTTLGIEIQTQHDFENETFVALQKLVDDFAITTPTLAADTNMGVIAQNVISGIYTMPTAGPTTITLSIGVTLAGIVEARVNGGAFATVIAAGLLTGTILGVVLNDTIEVRHTEPGIVPTETFMQLSNPASAADGYAILTF